MKSKRTKFLKQKIVLDFDGVIRTGRIEDIEFDKGLGPLFLFVTPYGNKAWLTRKELAEHEVVTK